MPPIVDIHTHAFNSLDYATLQFIAAHVGHLGQARTELLKAMHEALRREVESGRSRLPARAEDLKETLFYDLAQECARELAGKESVPPEVAASPEFWAAPATGTAGAAPNGWGESLADFSLLGFLHYCWLTLTHDTEQMVRELIHEAGGEDNPPVQLFITHVVDMWTAFRPDLPLLGRSTLEQAAALSAVACSSDPDLKGRDLAFMAFDPNAAIEQVGGGWQVRAGALADLRKAVDEHGCIGVKLYPLMGFRPSGNAQAIGADGQPMGLQRGQACDEALERLYGYCVSKALPIVAHTRWEGAWACPGARGNADPELWRPVLVAHPTLRLDLAHLGGAEFLTGAAPAGWALTVVDLIERYNGVYTDTADHILGRKEAETQAYLANLTALIDASPLLGQRLLYGSDWHAILLFTHHPEEYLREVQARLVPLLTTRAPGFLGDNALRFLGLKRGGANRKRVIDFYKAHGPYDMVHTFPPWWPA